MIKVLEIDDPLAGHDKFCPIWIVSDRIMTECECELINKVQQSILEKAKESIQLALRKSQNVNDIGMYKDKTGSEDPTERAYHRGLQDSCLILEALQKEK